MDLHKTNYETFNGMVIKAYVLIFVSDNIAIDEYVYIQPQEKHKLLTDIDCLHLNFFYSLVCWYFQKQRELYIKCQNLKVLSFGIMVPQQNIQLDYLKNKY